jgi:hypothetical protein
MRPEAQQAYGLIVHLVMGGWYPICLALFIFLKPERAVATGLVTGFLLLPKASYDLPGFPNYDKALSIVLGVFVAALLFDSGRLLTWRPRSVDLPMGILCLAPFLSAVINGDGAYEGISNSFDFSMRWGLPWILGRIYFHDFEAQKFLAATVVAGALIYVPFALYEVKMSPQLHKLVYGVPLKSFKHAMRGGGLWRPNVFISHGLAYGLYNGIAAMLAFWLWFSKSCKSVLGVPIGACAVLLILMAFAIQSMGAVALMTAGIGILFCGARWRLAVPLVCLLAVPPSYILLRQGFRWDGEILLETAKSVFGKERAISLNVRLTNEAQLADRILERPWFGYNDFRDFTGNTDEKHAATVDSMWLLYLGLYGVVSLIGLYGFQLVAPFLLWRKLPPGYWSNPVFASAVALGITSVLVAVDGLVNAVEIAAFTCAGGGVAHLLGTPEGRRSWTS